jgi:hypothetical protein
MRHSTTFITFILFALSTLQVSVAISPLKNRLDDESTLFELDDTPIKPTHHLHHHHHYYEHRRKHELHHHEKVLTVAATPTSASLSSTTPTATSVVEIATDSPSPSFSSSTLQPVVEAAAATPTPLSKAWTGLSTLKQAGLSGVNAMQMVVVDNDHILLFDKVEKNPLLNKEGNPVSFAKLFNYSSNGLIFGAR